MDVAVVASITPELTPADAIVSSLVATVTPYKLPAVAFAPTFKPITVTVTAMLAAIA